MLLLLTYTGPFKKFNKEHSILAKIQIDNSLNLGWKRQDIILTTDFAYEYNGVKSLKVPNGLYYDFDSTSNKIPVIVYLIEKGILTNKELFWYHDFDYFQLERVEEKELNMENFDLGLTPYGYKPQWNLGCIFFRPKAIDIFKLIDKTILYERKSNRRCDEKALKRLIVRRRIDKKRFKELNVTYNLTKRCIATNYTAAEKPLKAVHFHPWEKDELMNDTGLNIFMYGKNRLRMPLVNKRLATVFQQHGVK